MKSPLTVDVEERLPADVLAEVPRHEEGDDRPQGVACGENLSLNVTT